MDADVKDSRAGGSRPPDIGKFLQVGGSSDPSVQRRFLGGVQLDRGDPGGVSPQVCLESRELVTDKGQISFMVIYLIHTSG